MKLFNTTTGEQIPIKFSQYPDGQPHITIGEINPQETFLLRCSIKTTNDLVNVLLIANIVRFLEVEVLWLMGQRMDRRIDDLSPLTRQVIEDILDDYVSISSVLDIHNKQGSLFQSLSKYPKLISDFVKNFNCDIVFPDRGALARYSQEYSNSNLLSMNKSRDQNTGWVVIHGLESGEKKSDECIIVDDICAGGITFILAAKKLRELGYKKIYLFTTHGVYVPNKGKNLLDLMKEIDEVYSTNSWDYNDLPDTDLQIVKQISRDQLVEKAI